MSGPDTSVAARRPERSPIAVVALGVAALLLGFVVLPLFPLVVIGVVTWWLAEGLRRGPAPRLGWLGWAAIGIFMGVTAAMAVVVTSFDAHFDCGGTLGGYGESASARLDTRCRDARAWRVIVAGVGTLLIGAVGTVVVRRLGVGRSASGVAASVVGGMVGLIVALVFVLVVT